jgi:hypothetical protein
MVGQSADLTAQVLHVGVRQGRWVGCGDGATDGCVDTVDPTSTGPMTMAWANFARRNRSGPAPEPAASLARSARNRERSSSAVTAAWRPGWHALPEECYIAGCTVEGAAA